MTLGQLPPSLGLRLFTCKRKGGTMCSPGHLRGLRRPLPGYLSEGAAAGSPGRVWSGAGQFHICLLCSPTPLAGRELLEGRAGLLHLVTSTSHLIRYRECCSETSFPDVLGLWFLPFWESYQDTQVPGVRGSATPSHLQLAYEVTC